MYPVGKGLDTTSVTWHKSELWTGGFEQLLSAIKIPCPLHAHWANIIRNADVWQSCIFQCLCSCVVQVLLFPNQCSCSCFLFTWLLSWFCFCPNRRCLLCNCLSSCCFGFCLDFCLPSRCIKPSLLFFMLLQQSFSCFWIR